MRITYETLKRVFEKTNEKEIKVYLIGGISAAIQANVDLYRKNGIEPKRLRFVYEKISKESTLVLIEGQKNGKPGLKIENPLILYNEDGSMSEEYSNLIVEVKK